MTAAWSLAESPAASLTINDDVAGFPGVDCAHDAAAHSRPLSNIAAAIETRRPSARLTGLAESDPVRMAFPRLTLFGLIPRAPASARPLAASVAIEAIAARFPRRRLARAAGRRLPVPSLWIRAGHSIG